MDDQADFSTIDEYLALFPPEVRERLRLMRAAIRETAPEAAEKISYRMPTFFYHGNLVHFAAFKGHIGFYPGPEGIAAFEPRLGRYVHAKGSVQFPLDEPLPLDLVREITAFRYKQNGEKKKRG